MTIPLQEAISIVGWSTVVTGLVVLIWKFSALQTSVQDILINHLPHVLSEISALRNDIADLWKTKKDK